MSVRICQTSSHLYDSTAIYGRFWAHFDVVKNVGNSRSMYHNVHARI